MDDTTKTQPSKDDSQSAQKLDKIQKELDDLEKRAQDELAQKPSFSVVADEDQKSDSQSLSQESQGENSLPPAPQMSQDQGEGGKIISEQVVEDSQSQSTPEDQAQGEETDPQTVQVQPNQSGDEPKESVDTNKMTKTVFWVVLMLFLVCLTAIGAYLVGSRGSTSSTESTPTPLAVKTPLPVDTPQPVVINTYSSEIYSYSFKYPNDMEMITDLNNPDEVVGISKDGNDFVVYAGSETFVAEGEAGEEEKYQISGLEATRVVYVDKYEVYELPENDSSVNMIVVRYAPGSSAEYESIMTEMLESFVIKGADVSAASSPTPESSPQASGSPSPVPEGN